MHDTDLLADRLDLVAPPSHEQMLDMARRLLAEEQERREDACLSDLQALLDQHGCELFAQPTPAGGGLWQLRVGVRLRGAS